MTDQSSGTPMEEVLAYDGTFVPRYARPFGELLLRAVDLPPRASLLDLACRTGYPSVQLLQMASDGRVIALDPDPVYLELARARAGEDLGRRIFFKQGEASDLRFSDQVFTNVVGNLIDRAANDRGVVLAESARVLREGGQLVLTMPLKGSFQEVADLLHEVALRNDLSAVSERVDQYLESLPSPEAWQGELEARGFEHVAVETEAFALEYISGRDLFADPTLHTAALPEWRWCVEASAESERLLDELRETIDVYFRGRILELSVIAGCVSARRSGVPA